MNGRDENDGVLMLKEDVSLMAKLSLISKLTNENDWCQSDAHVHSNF